MRVLLVEDDAEIADLLQRAIRGTGWAVDAVGDGEGALEALATTSYDLAILDLGLPDRDGLDVCREARDLGITVPILILTARGGLADRVRGLDSGADDYLAKPFAAGELLARLRALARRPVSALGPTLRIGDVQLDPASRRVHRGGNPIRLTAREFALLEFMMREADRVLSRAAILEHVWDDNFDPVANAVDVLVGRVRRKLDPGGDHPLIHTVRGAGYVLSVVAPNHAG